MQNRTDVRRVLHLLGWEMKDPALLTRRCRAESCAEEVLPPLAGEGVCLDHFVEMVIRSADGIRARCLKGEPADEDAVQWLFSDAQHTVRALASEGEIADPSQNEKLLELLLCLANLQDYVSHHSLPVRRTR
jgi:hypothetical protein